MIVRLRLDFAKMSEAFRIEFAEICEEPDVLSELARDESTQVLIKVAENPFTKLEDQIRLANNSDSRVQCAVVQNKRKYKEVINTLLSKSSVVKINLAQNVTDHEFLDMLADDSDSRVRREVAKNSNTIKKTLLKLVKDPEASVRIAIAELKRLDEELRKTLAKDDDEDVRKQIAKRSDNTPLDLSHMATSEKAPKVLKAIARNRVTNGTTLDWLAKSNRDLWFYISENPNTLDTTLSKLANSQSIDVLIAVLKHRNTSDDTISKLKGHQEKIIRNLAYYQYWLRKSRQ